MALQEIIQRNDASVGNISLHSVCSQMLDIINSVREVSITLHGLSTVWIIWAYGNLPPAKEPEESKVLEVVSNRKNNTRKKAKNELSVNESHRSTRSSARFKPVISYKDDDDDDDEDYDGGADSENNYEITVADQDFHDEEDINEEIKTEIESGFPCDTCGLNFQEKRYLIAHVRLHTGEKPYSCAVCDMRFRASKNLLKHTRRMHKDYLPYACSHCTERYYSQRELIAHRKIHCEDNDIDDSADKTDNQECTAEEITTDEGLRFKCSVCDKLFHLQHHLVAHMRIHTGEKPYSCEVCGMNFRLRKNVQKHIKRVHKDHLPYECSQCKERFRLQRDLIAHERVHRLENDRMDGYGGTECAAEEIMTDDGLRFKCSVCEKLFRIKYRLVSHMRIHTGERPYTCEICNLSFRQSKNYLKHKKRMHATDKTHPCGECELNFDNRWDLVAHKKTHNEFETLFCSLCQKVFKKNYSYKLHNKKFHSGEPIENLVCSQCGKTFEHESSLRKHESRHDKLPSHKCTVCDKAFYEKSNLEAHARIHNGERPFQCAQCGQTFNHPSTLKKHELWHSGNKSFKCDVCSKCYSTKGKLQYHRIRHGDVKKFICHVCGRAFYDRNDLRKHEKVHTGLKPHACEHCGRAFAENWNLKVHVKNVHGGISTRNYGCQFCGESFKKRNLLIEHETSCFKKYPTFLF